MVHAVINLGEHENRVLNVIKGKFGLKNKSEAINFIINEYERAFLEPELRPEYRKKIEKIRKKGEFEEFSSIEELRASIENI